MELDDPNWIMLFDLQIICMDLLYWWQKRRTMLFTILLIGVGVDLISDEAR